MTALLTPDLLALSVDDCWRGAGERWLGASEQTRYSALRVPKRRREWLAGRIAAKELVRRRHGLSGDGSLQSVEIVGQPKRRPGYRLGPQPAPFCLSISHAGGVALAALGRSPDHWLGVDVEAVEARGTGFESLLLSPTERAALLGVDGAARLVALTRLWVVKEAVSKALGLGLAIALPKLESGLGPRALETTRVAISAPIAERAGLLPCTATVGLFELGELLGAWAVIAGRERS